MKTTRLFMHAMLAIAMTFTSCTDDTEDDTDVMEEEVITTPLVTYSETNLTATFSTEGNSPAPTVNWNGDQGSFFLAGTVQGVVINSTTGVLSWDRTLEPGENAVDVVVSNSAGQSIIPMNIINPLQGTFTGTYDDVNYFQVILNADGSMALNADDEAFPFTATGTWNYEDGDIMVNYVYQYGGDYSISGALVQSSSDAIWSGNWYFGHDAQASSLGGIFEIILD